ncbi:restriction endonuclease subunit S [Weeksellaceae bacterium TAE3-ERU29]|nr:restriction endonuclease subunit S [Weeksellaceae bacterium TAE3-ERU29]
MSWEEVELGSIVNIKTGKLDANASDINGIYPFFTCSKEISKINKFAYDCEAVLVAGNGDLNVKYYNGKFNAYQRTYIIESIDKLVVNVKYLYYFLEIYIKFLRNQSIGGVIKYIKLGNLTKAKIPLPPLSVQKEIVSKLDQADALRQKDQTLLSYYDELAQSIFYEMFGDPVLNEKGWEVKSLGDICTKIGSGATPRGGNSSYKEEGISLIRSLNVHDLYFKMDNLAFIDDTQAKKLKNVIVEENDVLFNITGASVCRTCIVPNNILPARVNQHVSILRVINNIFSPIFLVYTLSSIPKKRELLNLSSSGGATREAITKTQLENIEIISPPIELQNQFAEIIENIEKQKALVQEQATQSENLFQALLQESFG